MVQPWNGEWQCFMNVEYGNPFAGSLGPKWRVEKVLVDGQPGMNQEALNSRPVTSASTFEGGGHMAMGQCLISTSGEHEIEVLLDVAFPLVGTASNGFEKTDPATWGPMSQRKTVSAKVKVNVVPDQ
jgi:hypothetical protein